MGAVFGSVLAMTLACSSKTVLLNKVGGNQRSDGGGAGGDTTQTDAMAGGPVVDSGPGSSGGGSSYPGVPKTTPIKASHKLDLLLVVDNSLSTADKQAVMSKSVPDLIERLTAPSSGFTDIHVGIITSSIGGHGSTLCSGAERDVGPLENEERNDHAHLLATRPRFKIDQYPGALSPDANGVLEWTAGDDVSALTTTVQGLVTAADEFGCGLESQLEAAQRFLVDPQPYDHLNVANCPGGTEPCVFPAGIDQELLTQRAAFLRPDSVVAVVELSDENDCSIRESGQYYYAARTDIILPHGSRACATNPNDPCCYSCVLGAVPQGCTADPNCSGVSAMTPAAQDPPNLRCFHEKQRFGMDFLYPVARYVNMLSKPVICTSRADLAADDSGACKDLDGDGSPDLKLNPLFVQGNTVRDPSMVYFLTIGGVPYQDLAAISSTDTTLTYQSPSDLVKNGVWAKVLGNDDPGNYTPPVLPTDSLMIESKDPRGGNDGETPPVPLAGPGANYLSNPVNGHEWNNTDQTDLQYACIFALPETRDCQAAFQSTPAHGCDCRPGGETDQNPLCQDPMGNYGSTQRFAKAYPGLRQLAVAKALGANGLPASICARNLTDATRSDYGYRPAVDLLVKQVARSAK